MKGRLTGILQTIFDEVFNTGDLHAVEKHYAPDFHAWGPAIQDSARGPQSIRDFMEQIHKNFDEIRYVIDDAVEAGDRLAVRWRATGRHAEPHDVPHVSRTLPAMEKGAPFEIRGVSFCTFNDKGQMVEVYQMVDHA